MDRKTREAIETIRNVVAKCGLDGATGVCVDPEDHLPSGWVKLFDDWVSCYGIATEIAGVLEEAKPTDAETFWHAISNCTVEKDSEVDSKCYHGLDHVHLDAVPFGYNGNRLTLLELRCNAGTRYLCGIHGHSEDAVANAIASGLEFHKQPIDAIADYLRLAGHEEE